MASQEVENFSDEQTRMVSLIREYVHAKHSWFFQKLFIDGDLWVFHFMRPDSMSHPQVGLFHDEVIAALSSGQLIPDIRRKIDVAFEA